MPSLKTAATEEGAARFLLFLVEFDRESQDGLLTFQMCILAVLCTIGWQLLCAWAALDVDHNNNRSTCCFSVLVDTLSSHGSGHLTLIEKDLKCLPWDGERQIFKCTE